MTPANKQIALAQLALLLEREEAAEVTLASVEHLRPGLDQLIEAGALVVVGDAVRFFHESFRDFVYAQAFVESPAHDLVYEVQSRGQDLSTRALVRQVLEHERGLDRPGYTRDAGRIVHSQEIRFHLRDVVFDTMRGDPDPQRADWQIIESLLLDPQSESHGAARSIVTQSAWFALVDRLGLILRWLSSESAPPRDLATDLLAAAQAHDPDRVAAILNPFLAVDDDYLRRIRWILSAPRARHTTESTTLIARAISHGAFDDGHTFASNDPIWMVLADLAGTDATAVTAVLSAYIARGRALRADQELFKNSPFPSRDHWLEDCISEAAASQPLVFADAILPVVIEHAETSATREAHPPRRGDPWSYRFSPGQGGFHWQLFYGLEDALRRLSTRHPVSIRRIGRTLVAHADLDSMRHLLYRAWSANPTIFGTDAAAFLGNNAAFECGSTGDVYDTTAELIQAVEPHLDDQRLADLQRAVLSYHPARQSEQRADWAQWRLLEVFSPERLIPQAAARRNQLRAEFGEGVPASRGVWTGVVGPPIPEPDARVFTDEQWTAAMREFDADDTRVAGERLVGGAVEQARVLESAAQRDPDRFARLGANLPADINPVYGNAILLGLADAEPPAHPELLFALIRHHFEMPERLHGQWVHRALARVAGQDIPRDILDIVSWYATSAPDPSRENWRQNVGTDHWPNDPLDEGINTTRGAATEALSALVFADGSRINPLWPALQRVVADKTTAVRACAALAVSSVLHHDREKGLQLFTALTGSAADLWSSRHAERLLAYVANHHYEDAEGTLRQMLSAEGAETRQAGARIAAMTALSNPDGLHLVRLALDADASSRTGVAQVAGANVGGPDYRETCIAWLVTLFNDLDEGVRAAASEWCRTIDPAALGELRELTLAYIDSQAYRDDEELLLWALDESDSLIAELGLHAIEDFVARHRGQLDEIGARVAGGARTASSLAIRAYTSATSTTMKERALDVIDALLAARISHMDDLVAGIDGGRRPAHLSASPPRRSPRHRQRGRRRPR